MKNELSYLEKKYGHVFCLCFYTEYPDIWDRNILLWFLLHSYHVCPPHIISFTVLLMVCYVSYTILFFVHHDFFPPQSFTGISAFFCQVDYSDYTQQCKITGIPNRSIPPPWSKWLVQEWANDLNQSVGENCRTFGRIWIRNFISATKRHKDGVNLYLLLPWEGNFQKMKCTEEIRVKEGKWESSFECLEPALPEVLDFHLH